MHLCDLHASLNVGLVPAVSTLALNRVRLLSRARKPHCMGNALLIPFEFGAMTGTMSVGYTSPSVMSGLPWVSINFAVRAEHETMSVMRTNSGRSFSKQYLQHMAVFLSKKLRLIGINYVIIFDLVKNAGNSVLGSGQLVTEAF